MFHIIYLKEEEVSAHWPSKHASKKPIQYVKFGQSYRHTPFCCATQSLSIIMRRFSKKENIEERRREWD
jgi:hypothetical protein